MNEFRLRRLEAELEAAIVTAAEDLEISNTHDNDTRVTVWAQGYLDGLSKALIVLRLGGWRQGETS